MPSVSPPARLAAAGCGDDDSGDSAGDGGNENAGSGGGLYDGGDGGEETQDAGDTATRLRLAANPAGEFAFDKTSLSAKPGPVVIAFANASRVPHAVEVEGNHEQAGMVGTPTVR